MTKSIDMVMDMVKVSLNRATGFVIVASSAETLVASMTIKAVAGSDMAGFFVDSPAGNCRWSISKMGP